MKLQVKHNQNYYFRSSVIHEKKNPTACKQQFYRKNIGTT